MPSPTGRLRRSGPSFKTGARMTVPTPKLSLSGPSAKVEDVSTFWHSVKTNLQAGRVRSRSLIADEIPSGIAARSSSFSNAQMDPAEVLAIEVKQFVGDGEHACSVRRGPNGIGSNKRRPWSAANRGSGTRSSLGPFGNSDLSVGMNQETAVARRLLDWAKKTWLRIWWGQARKDGSFFPFVHQLVRPATYSSPCGLTAASKSSSST